MDIWYNICTNMYMRVSKNRVYPETAICGREQEEPTSGFSGRFPDTPFAPFSSFFSSYPSIIPLIFDCPTDTHLYMYIYIHIHIICIRIDRCSIDHIKTSNLGYSVCTYDVLLDIITFIQIFVDSHIMVPWIFMRITKSILPYHNPIWMLYTLISH
jgi:hypothetical protein